MEQSENKKTDTKENLKLFGKNNLNKIISILIMFIIIIVSFFVWKENQDKKNFLISDKYIKAGILLGNGENEIDDGEWNSLSHDILGMFQV